MMYSGDPFQSSGYSKNIDTLNILAGKNQEQIKEILKWMNNGVSDKFLNILSAIVLAEPYEIGKEICKVYWFLSISGINPENSPTFIRRLISDGIAPISKNLHDKASDLSFRSSFAPIRKEPKKRKDGV